MYKFLVFFCFFLNSWLHGQNQQTSLNQLKTSFESLSYGVWDYKASYIMDDETLYFMVVKSNEPIYAYKMLVKDIHPEGIYLVEKDEYYSIRVLSLNNGHVFIKENLSGKYRHSSTANFVDIGTWDKNYKLKILEFILSFQKFVTGKKATEDHFSDDDEIIIVTDEKK